MSSFCCVCSCVKRQNSHNIFEERMGLDENAPLISEVLMMCVAAADYVLQISSESSDICKKCCEKLVKYYKTIELEKQIRSEIIETLKKTRDEDDDKVNEDLFGKEDEAAAAEGNEIEDIQIFEEGDIVEEVFEYENGDEEFIKCEIATDDEEEIIDIDTTQLEVVTENDDNQQSAAILENKIELQEQNTTNSDIDEQTYENQNYAFDDVTFNNDNDDEYVEQFEVTDFESGIKVVCKKGIKREPIKCFQCDEKFVSKKKLNAHTRRMHFAGYVCDHCGKTLYSYSGFTSHRQSHNPEKEFECNVCGAKYHTKVNLKHHLAWHSGETPFECDICHKRFVHNISLYKHKRIHDESTRRIECTVCGFKFRTNAHLRRHMISHTGTKAHSCPVCGKCFSQGYNMKAHLREHTNPNATRPQRMKCHNCTRTFTSKKNFEEHSKNCVQHEN